MATKDEYQAVHGGKEPPRGKGTANDFGGVGCIAIFKDKGGVIGRWSSWETASLALNKLQRLGGGAYWHRLEESREWVKGLGNTTGFLTAAGDGEVAQPGTCLRHAVPAGHSGSGRRFADRLPAVQLPE